MSTYLVAMMVGDFVCREGEAGGTPLRVCSTPDKRGLTGFALEAARQQLEYFNAYFGIPYPFDKLDIVAIPDFAAGAMENVGAITFRERFLLVDPERASLGVRKQVASILAHEIAHMWFGNLVTMKWWDDIWLNEGFATWAESKPVAVWRPEWNVHLDEASATQSALGLDALRSTRPIRTKVETPEEINEVFDAIAYQKSAAVLRMLEGFVGEDGFRKGLSAYLAKHAFGNATGEDFWREMTAVTGRPIDRIMQSFVEQPGAPVVSVRTTCTGTTTELAVRQERFIGAPGADVPTQTWTMPVCFTANAGQPRCEVIARREARRAWRRRATTCSPTRRAAATTFPSTRRRVCAACRAQPPCSSRLSAWGCSATSGGWCGEDATTSACTWTSLRHCRMTRPPP